jgi:hypothetical protein
MKRGKGIKVRDDRSSGIEIIMVLSRRGLFWRRKERLKARAMCVCLFATGLKKGESRGQTMSRNNVTQGQ